MCQMAMAKNMIFSIELTKEKIIDARASFVKSMGKGVEEAPTSQALKTKIQTRLRLSRR